MFLVVNDGDNLIDTALINTINKIGSYSVKIEGHQSLAIKNIIQHLNFGLKGELKPSYYLSSLAPGSGKTEAISGFIKAWKSNGFKPEGGILICLQSKNQITSLIKRLSLDESDFSVLTKDESLNKLGSGSGKIDIVPVLITTQQMIVSRLKDRSFTKASDFYYLGKPRSLRVWDETFALSQPVRVEVASLYSLAVKVGQLDRSFSEALMAFANELTNAVIGSPVPLPMDLGKYAKRIVSLNRDNKEQGRSELAARYVSTLDALAIGGGRTLLLDSYGGRGGGLTLIGAGKPLPDDFAPAIIFDASGSVRVTCSPFSGR